MADSENQEVVEQGTSAAETPTLLTRQELADRLGQHKGTITRWESDGMPVAKKMPRGQASLFDLAAVQEWRERTNATKLSSNLSLEQERARLTRAQTEKVERENLRRAGELLPRDEVARAGQAYTAAWASKVRGIPRRMTQAGFITRDQEPQVAAICREILIEIAGWKTLADVEDAAPAVETTKPKRRKAKKKKKPTPSSTPPPAAAVPEAPASPPPIVDEVQP